MTTFSRTATLLAAIALVPALASAQVNVSASGTATAGTNSTGVAATAQTTTTSTPIGKAGQTAQDKGAKEIDRRVTALNALKVRIDAMVRVTDTLKQTIEGNIANQIQLLTQLKAKIAADTDLATLKTDVKSITDSYRIYRLVIPQGAISAMADRVVNVTIMMQAVGAKLQARVQAAAAAGNDTTAATKSLTDLSNNIVTAQSKAKAAMDAILPLKPDQGDKATMDANDAALKAARTDLHDAQQALVAGRKDITAIIQFLKTAKVSATASSTTQTQSH